MNTFSIDYNQMHRLKHLASVKQQFKSVSQSEAKQNLKGLRQLESASNTDPSVSSIRGLARVWNMIVGSLVCQGGQSNQMCANYGHVIGSWSNGLPVCRDCKIQITDVAMVRSSKLRKAKNSR